MLWDNRHVGGTPTYRNKSKNKMLKDIGIVASAKNHGNKVLYKCTYIHAQAATIITRIIG